MNTRNTIITLVGGTIFIISIFLIISDPVLHTLKIGAELIGFTPIPYVIGWVFRPENNKEVKE